MIIEAKYTQRKTNRLEVGSAAREAHSATTAIDLLVANVWQGCQLLVDQVGLQMGSSADTIGDMESKQMDCASNPCLCATSILAGNFDVCVGNMVPNRVASCRAAFYIATPH